MYRIYYGFINHGGKFHADVEGCKTFAEAEQAFLCQLVFQDCYIRAIEKL